MGCSRTPVQLRDFDFSFKKQRLVGNRILIKKVHSASFLTWGVRLRLKSMMHRKEKLHSKIFFILSESEKWRFYFGFSEMFLCFTIHFLLPGLTLLLASWHPWQDLAKFLLHLGNHGSHGKTLTKILRRCIIIPRSNLNKIEKIQRFQNFDKECWK